MWRFSVGKNSTIIFSHENIQNYGVYSIGVNECTRREHGLYIQIQLAKSGYGLYTKHKLLNSGDGLHVQIQNIDVTDQNNFIGQLSFTMIVSSLYKSL